MGINIKIKLFLRKREHFNYIRSSNWIILNTAYAQSVDYLRVARSMFCIWIP